MHIVEPFFMKYLSIIMAIIISILYIFISNDLLDESTIINVWYKSSKSISKAYIDENIKISGIFPLNFSYKQGEYLHYFDSYGVSSYYYNMGTTEDRVAVNNEGYITYRRFGVINEAYDKNGNILWRTNTSVYPEVAPYSKTIMNHASDNARMVMVDWNNNVLSKPVQYGEFATSGMFAEETGDYAAGFTSGNVALIDRMGGVKFAISTILSEINIVKGVGISERGSFVACVSGIRNEYLTVYGSDGKIIWYTDLKLNRRRNVSVYISERSMLVYVLYDRSVLVYALASGKLTDVINIEKNGFNNAVYMKLYAYEDTTLLAVAKDNTSNIFIYDNKNKRIIFDKFVDSLVYDLAISSSKTEYLITTDKNIYTYKRLKL